MRRLQRWTQVLLLSATGFHSGWGAEVNLADPGQAAIARGLDAHIRFLADDLLEGRGAGTTGHEIAALYVASQFQSLGLVPVGDSGGWMQSVPLLESRRTGEEARFLLHVDGQVQELERTIDFLAAPHALFTNAMVSAPLVFVGYGVHAPELGYDDLEGASLQGAIAVCLAKAPPKFPATTLAHHSQAREKMRHLMARGAVGVIQLPTQKDLEEMPWPRRIIASQFPAMRWTLPDGTPSEVYPQSKASMTLSPAGAAKVFVKSPQTLEDTLAKAQRSQPQSFPLNVSATLSTWSTHKALKSPNVLGFLPGRDPQRSNEVVVLTAHLDHQGVGPAVKGDRIYNGAYDNAIGVGMMIEVARALAVEGKGPRRSVLFAAVTAEEKGLLGSDYLATHFLPAAGRPVANFNLDMVLLATATRSFVLLGLEHSTLRAPAEAAARNWGIKLLPDPFPERVVFVRSDQYSFIRQGVPALFPKAAIAPGTTVPADAITPDLFTKTYYHQPGDDLSLPRDAVSAVRFIQFMTELARQVCDADEAPRWNPGDFFGTTFGQQR